MNDIEFVRLERIREAIEDAGGFVEVVYDLTEPTLWEEPGKRQYEEIAYVNLCNLTLDEALFRQIGTLETLVTLDLKNSVLPADGLAHLHGCKRLHLLELESSNATGVAMNYVGELTWLRSLNLALTPNGDEDLECLHKLANLDTLVVSYLPITSEGLVPLQSLGDLTILAVDNTRVDDRVIAILSDNCPKLDLLNLSNTDITSKGVSWIPRLQLLDRLELDYVEIDGESLRDFSQCAYLEHLSLNDTGITDSVIRYLAGIKKLEFLALDRTQITDACVDYFQDFPSLTSLSVSGTQLTSQGIERLKQLLPNAYVST